jgi:hypothetical protein
VRIRPWTISFLALAAVAAAPAPEPWSARGAQVRAAAAAYAARLDRFYSVLSARLQEEAADLSPRLQAAEAKPLASGYQVLPRLLPETPPPAVPPRAVLSRWDWRWAQTLVGRETAVLEPLEADLARAATLAPSERRPVYEKLAAAYPPLPESQRNVDAYIAYNQLWQESIAGNKAIYDRQTQLENAVLERQTVRDALASSAGTPGRAPDAVLRAREAELSRVIHAATDGVATLPFIRAERPSAHAWIVTVPFETDIQDEAFLGAFRSALEEAWRVVDGPDEYRVVVTLTRLTPAELYRGAAPPKPGDPIDLSKHLAHFPEGAAVLTTGAVVTHVTGGRCIVIGPNDLSPHDLAHELGHILGFKDVYFRGYKDLGADGFEVHEVVAETGDIMGGRGPVRKEQLRSVIEAIEGHGASPAPENARSGGRSQN